MFVELDGGSSQQFGSQYFRRALAQHFRLQAAWDWREYVGPEQWVLEILDLFRGNHVSISQ